MYVRCLVVGEDIVGLKVVAPCISSRFRWLCCAWDRESREMSRAEVKLSCRGGCRRYRVWDCISGMLYRATAEDRAA